MEQSDSYFLISISFLGGLGFFLYGLMAMSESLQRVAGKRMRFYLEHSTKTVFRGLLSGAIFTALIQSSSGTTVLIIGLLNAGLINFRQAATLIIGSNIGTVITGFIIGIKISNYSLLFVALGMFLRMMGNSKIRKEYGRAIFGFGILFFGMNLMGESMYPLKESEYFNYLLEFMETNPFIGLLAGTFLTALVQSSSAMVGILQEMFYQEVITLNQLVPVLLGSAVGTTITAGLASLNTGVEARKAAFFHFLFNIVGALFFMPLFISGFFLNSIEFIYDAFLGNWDLLDGKMKVASLNAYFRIGYALAFIPIISFLEDVVEKFVKPDEDDKNGIYGVNLDISLLQTPDLAYKNINKEILHMVDLAKGSIENALGALNSTQNTLPLLVTKGEKLENAIDTLRENIRDYTVQIQGGDHKEGDISQNTFFIFDTIKSLERIGDYAQNVIKTIIYKKENKIFLPEFFYEKINDLGEVIVETIELCKKIIETGDERYINAIEENRGKADSIYKELRNINVRKFSYYDNINYINYVVKNIGDNFFKVQLNVNEIVGNYIYCKESNIKGNEGDENAG
ncbi:MAG: Na/Pi cotransporter family protein [Clostridia bacterium]|nr:Na/Pi cotransporter family protein [Clostridia bacterium]